MKTIVHYKTFKVRLLPTKEQEELLWKSCNVSRFVYNWALDYYMKYYEEHHKTPKRNEARNYFISIKNKQFPWLLDVSSQVSNNAFFDLDNAYTVFFRTQKKSKTKFSSKKIAHYQRIGKKLTLYDMIGHPKFKVKKHEKEPRFQTRADSVYFNNETVNIEKIGKVKYQQNYNKFPIGKRLDYKFLNCRVKLIHNKWMLMVSLECENQAPELNNYSLGIDVGVKSTAVISYNNSTQHKSFKNINKTERVRKLKKRQKHYERLVSKCYLKNSNNDLQNTPNYNKTKNIKRYEQLIRDIYYKLSNIRRNYNHHISKEIVSLLPQKIIMEDLNIRGMMKNKHLSKAIQEQCLYELMWMIQYKAQMNGIEIVKADRFYPSSKKCSCCDHIKKDLKLSDRTYICPECGNIIDRDLNAAVNLENYNN